MPLASDSARAWPSLDFGATLVDLERDDRRRILWALGDARWADARFGLAFDLGFGATLLSRDGCTYILDRRTSSVRRISTPTTR